MKTDVVKVTEFEKQKLINFDKITDGMTLEELIRDFERFTGCLASEEQKCFFRDVCGQK